jgi:hypothetical protein
MVCQTSACIFSKLPYPVKRFERQCQPHGKGREFCMQRTPRPIAENQGVRLLSIIIFFVKEEQHHWRSPSNSCGDIYRFLEPEEKTEMHRRHFQFKVKLNDSHKPHQTFPNHFSSISRLPHAKNCRRTHISQRELGDWLHQHEEAHQGTLMFPYMDGSNLFCHAWVVEHVRIYSIHRND